MPLPIEHLPLRTQSLLRSTCQLPSFASILETLIQNSLEASSTSLELSIDLSTYTLKCKDNGTGISWSNLCLLDRGGRYSTNREGTRGEGLECIQDVAYLQVRTRCGEEGSEWSRRGGETVELRKLNQSGTREEGQGTTVIVRDIFYNFPVRRKLVSTSVSSTLSTIRSLVSNISLIHPTISFQLSDVSLSTPKTLVSVRNCSQGVLGRWRQLWGRSGIERVWEFDQSYHHHDKEASRIEAKGFVSLSASHGKKNQFIFVNSQPLPSHSILHKSLNSLFTRSSFSRHSSSLLSFPSPNSSSLNNSRSNSPTVGAKGRNTPKKTVEKWPIFLIDLRVPIDQVEFARGGGEGDLGWIEFTDEKRVIEFVDSIAKEFLVGHGFLSEAVAAGRGGGGEGGKRKRIELELEEEEETFTSEARGSRLDSNGVTPYQSQSMLNAIGRKQIGRDTGGLEQEAIKRRRISSTTPQPPPQPQPQLRARGEDLSVVPNTSSLLVNPASDPFSTTTKTWTDPTTHRAFEIDPRTGNNWRIDPVSQRNGAQDGREKVEGKGAECEGCVEGERGERRGIVDRRSLKRGRGNREIREGTEEGGRDREKQMPEWLKTSLAEWDNPIFPSAPPRRTHQIPCLPSTLTSTNPRSSSSKNPFPFSSSKPSLSFSSTRKHSQAPATLTHSRLSKLSSFFSSSTSPLSTSILPSSPTSFSRESLEQAQFIAQVDEKYLLVKLPLSMAKEEEGEGLVMFDQHAVSERIRVERYLEGLCREEGVEVVELEEEVGVVVGREEARELERWREEFERWGFKFEKRTRGGRGRKEEEGDYVQVWIKTVPKVVKERLLKDPKLLQELVRGYLAQLEEQPPRGEGGGGGWVGRLKSCPGGLVELINSKACRGAIMFNDRLSDEQAKDLLKQLAETRFPFMCAHARPSIVPIVNLPAPATTEARGGDRKGEGRRKIDWSLLT